MKASEELEEEKESSEDEDEEEKNEISHLAVKISKAWIRRKKKKGFPPNKGKKEKQNKMTLFAMNAKNLDIWEMNVQSSRRT